MKLFTKKPNKQTPRRRSATSAGKIHSYYTPVQQDRIDIDMSSRKAAKRTIRIKTLRARVEQLVVIGFVIFVAYMLLVLKGLPIINIDTSVTGYTSTRYSAKIQDIFSSSIFNTNKLTLERSSLQKQIMHDFPELSSVEVRSSFVGRRPEVYLKVNSVPFTYEALGVEYSISSEGRNVGTVTETPPEPHALLIKDESGVPTVKGDMVLTSADASYFITVKSAVEEKGRRVQYMRITSVPREVYVKLTDTKYEIKMYLEDDPKLQIGTFLAAEKTLGEGGAVPAQYIDVRAGEKVFWQ